MNCDVELVGATGDVAHHSLWRASLRFAEVHDTLFGLELAVHSLRAVRQELIPSLGFAKNKLTFTESSDLRRSDAE